MQTIMDDIQRVVAEQAQITGLCASRSANLLNVIRHADWCIEVHDKFNIGNINTHTECRSHNHNLSFSLQEVEQQLFLAAFRLDSRVVSCHLIRVFFFQNIVQRVHICSRLRKDKHRTIFMVFTNRLAELDTEFQSFLQRFLVQVTSFLRKIRLSRRKSLRRITGLSICRLS